MNSTTSQRGLAIFVFALAGAFVGCQKTPPGQGRFTGSAVLTGESQGTFPNTTAMVDRNRLTFGPGSPLAGCAIEVRGGPSEPRRPMSEIPNRCQFVVGAAPIEATTSGFFEASGDNLVLTINIANIDPATGNTGYRAWTYTFNGQRE